MIRKINETDYIRLVEIWESAVKHTHDFLKEEDFNYYKENIPNYFKHVNLIGFEYEGYLTAFLGSADGNLEMLFVDNDYRRKGIGKQLLEYSVSHCDVVKVDVNEQNIQAIDFYKKEGFEIIDRSETDGEGKEYPILHMKLKG